MDIAFISAIALLWGVAALLVRGFTKLDPSERGRP